MSKEEKKPKPEKSIVLKFYPETGWEINMKGLITLHDIHRLNRIIKVAYRNHRHEQLVQNKLKELEHENVV